MIDRIMLKIFVWIGNKLYSGRSAHVDYDIVIFHNVKNWKAKYGLSKWEMGFKTAKRV